MGSSVSTDRNWKTDTQWWYADLLGALGNLNGFSLLAGFRYDFFTTRFKNPYDYFGRTLGTDTADVKSNGYIPLVGGQVAYAGSCGSLLFRLVGFPTLLGQVTYNQTVGGWSRREASGNYNGQYFMEAFAEYAYVLTRTADLGIFARFNSTHGTANVNVEAVFPGQGVVRADTFSLGATRNNWTAGGRMNLRF